MRETTHVVSARLVTSSETQDRAHARLDALFDAAYERIYRFCLTRCGSEATAHDIASDTFADAARRTAQEPDAEIDVSWLFMVARRRVVDHWRRSDRQRARIRRLIQLDPPSESVGPTDDGDVADRVRGALDELPDRHRAVLVMRYLDEMSVSEIADALDQSYRATESTLARARRSFAAAWRKT